MRSCLSRRRADSNPGGGVWPEVDDGPDASVRAPLDFLICANNATMKRLSGTLGKMALPMRTLLPAARIMRFVFLGNDVSIEVREDGPEGDQTIGPFDHLTRIGRGKL